LKNADNAFCVQQVAGSNVEERLRRLETEIEELKNAVFCKKQDNNISQNIKKCSGRDLKHLQSAAPTK